MARRYAGILGSLAFVTTVARGVIDGSTAASTLTIAVVCMFAFAGIGLVAGSIAASIVNDSVRKRFMDEIKSQQEGSQPVEVASDA